MAFIVLLFLTLSSGSVLGSSDKWDCTDFYWRDFFGKIPDDAIPVGNNSNGDGRYIGLAYIRGYELLPATIFQKGGYGQVTAYTFILNATEHVKILCSPYKSAFEWIHTESRDLHLYETRNLIPGGSEVGQSLYLGRISVNNLPVIGKIFKDNQGNKGIWYTDGSKILNSLVYEVLAYNCKKAYLPCFGA